MARVLECEQKPLGKHTGPTRGKTRVIRESIPLVGEISRKALDRIAPILIGILDDDRTGQIRFSVRRNRRIGSGDTI